MHFFSRFPFAKILQIALSAPTLDIILQGDTPKTVHFVPLDVVEESTNWKFKPSKPFLACRTILHALTKGGEVDVQGLLTSRAELAALHGFDPALLPDGYVATLAEKAVGEFSPVCTVVGGEIAQEMLKVVQRNANPINNILVYDALDPDLRGLVEKAP